MDEMKNRHWLTDDLLDQGFQLAYFLFPHRPQALQIVLQSIGSLEVTAQRQVKRLKHEPVRQRSKVSFEDLHLIQRLILIHADQYQRLQEASTEPAPPTREDMLVRWVQYLALVASDNSFHASVAQCLLLHSYEAPEARTIYEFLIQSADTGKEDDQFRRWKSRIVERVLARFDGLVAVEPSRQGNVAPVRRLAIPRDLELAQAAQIRLVPWQVEAPALPAGFRPVSESSPWFGGVNSVDDDCLEIRRIAALLSPPAFASIAAGFKMASPADRLMTPEFTMPSNNDPMQLSRVPSRLMTLDERTAIRELVGRHAKNRAKIDPQEIRIRVNGLDATVLDVRSRQAISVDLGGSELLVEVLGLQQAGTVLLGSLVLRRDADGDPVAGDYIVELEKDRRLFFRIAGRQLSVSYEAPKTLLETALAIGRTVRDALSVKDVPSRPLAPQIRYAPGRLKVERARGGAKCPNCGNRMEEVTSSQSGDVGWRCVGRSCKFYCFKESGTVEAQDGC